MTDVCSSVTSVVEDTPQLWVVGLLFTPLIGVETISLIKQVWQRKGNMKGSIKIEVNVTNDCGNFPITEIFVIGRDNTYEGIEDWVEAFKKILYCVGFQSSSIEDVFGGGPV